MPKVPPPPHATQSLLTCVLFAERCHFFRSALAVEIHVFRTEHPRDDAHALQTRRERELTDDTDLVLWLKGCEKSAQCEQS